MFWVNADDFGISEEASLAILECFQKKLIHSTTACPNGKYFEQAMKLASRNELGDKIGIHLNITEGTPLTTAIRNERFFCDGNGNFHGNINRYKRLNVHQKKVLEEELIAQFQKFWECGLPIHHLDSHHHIHTAPNMSAIFLSMAKRYDIAGIRITRNVNVNNCVKRLLKWIFNQKLSRKKLAFSDHLGSIEDYLKKKKYSNWWEIDEVMVHPTYNSCKELIDNHSETFSPQGPNFEKSISELLRHGKRTNFLHVSFFSNAPAPYRTALWNGLAPQIDLNIYYELIHSKEREKGWEQRIGLKHKYNVLFAWYKRFNDALCPSIIFHLKKKNINIIGNYSTPSGIIAIIFCHLFQIPFVLSVDGGMVKNDGFIRRQIKKILLGHAKYWLSTGVYTDQYLTYYGAVKNRIFHYPFTSVNDDYICKSVPSESTKTNIRLLLGISEDKVVLSVGRFIKSKAFDVLLKAGNILPRYWGIYIVGGKPTEEYLQICSRCGLTNVHFIEHLDSTKLKMYYQAADCFALPTLTDVWGLVINEAMANGLPVVTTDHCVAGLEMVRPGRNGFIVPINNYSLLAERIKCIIDNSTLREQMAENALETAKNYTLSKMIDAHLTFISLLQNGVVQ